MGTRLQRRKLELKAKFEGGSSYSSLKHCNQALSCQHGLHALSTSTALPGVVGAGAAVRARGAGVGWGGDAQQGPAGVGRIHRVVQPGDDLRLLRGGTG